MTWLVRRPSDPRMDTLIGVLTQKPAVADSAVSHRKTACDNNPLEFLT